MRVDEIRVLIKQIEELISDDVAIAKFRDFGEVALYANREGYLTIAAAMLKCAIREPTDLHNLFNQDSEFGIDFLVTSEEEFDFVST